MSAPSSPAASRPHPTRTNLSPGRATRRDDGAVLYYLGTNDTGSRRHFAIYQSAGIAPTDDSWDASMWQVLDESRTAHRRPPAEDIPVLTAPVLVHLNEMREAQDDSEGEDDIPYRGAGMRRRTRAASDDDLDPPAIRTSLSSSASGNEAPPVILETPSTTSQDASRVGGNGEEGVQTWRRDLRCRRPCGDLEWSNHLACSVGWGR